MDTLFTTFLSPGMAPSVWPLQDSLLGKCLVDVTNWASSKNELGSQVVSGDQFVKKLSETTSGSGYWNELPNMYLETPYIMYFQTLPVTHSEFSTPSRTSKSTATSTPLSDYFLHQLHRLAVNKRLDTALQDMIGLCVDSLHSTLEGMENNLNNKNFESSASIKRSDDKELGAVSVAADFVEATLPCPCDKQETGDRYCQSHDLLIQDMLTTKRTCAWNIYFSAINIHDDMMMTAEEDDYCVNPCYDENLLDDSFEIEFSTTTIDMCDDLDSSFDSIDFTGVHFACESFNSGGGIDIDVFDVYDEDEDCIEYDNGSLCEIFNSELHIAPTWSHDVIIARKTNTSQSQRDCFNARKETSKYHKQCAPCRRDSYKSDKQQIVDEKLKKKRVHFPENEKNLVTVHRLVAWSHAYKQSRRSEWLRCAQDRAHFRRKIMKLSDIIEPVLKQKISQFDTF